LAVPHDVVDDDHGARASEPHGPVEVRGVVRFVRVEEDQVERSFPLGLEPRKGFQGRSYSHFDLLRQSCP